MTAPRAAWQGRVISVQPRIRLLRSFDERSHSYLGYVLQIDGIMDGEAHTFTVGIGKAAHAKHNFRNGDQVSGVCVPASDPNQEPAEFYKVSRLKLVSRGSAPHEPPPPWQGVAPDLDEYRQRGHRRLAARTYTSKCLPCIWGCRMAVEIGSLESIATALSHRDLLLRTQALSIPPVRPPAHGAGPARHGLG